MSILTLPARGSRRAKRGATALEYALVLAFVAVAVLGALSTLGGNLTDTIETVGGKVTDAADNDFTGT
jgi:pilus assembly protein Flp/PilA